MTDYVIPFGTINFVPQIKQLSHSIFAYNLRADTSSQPTSSRRIAKEPNQNPKKNKNAKKMRRNRSICNSYLNMKIVSIRNITNFLRCLNKQMTEKFVNM